MSKIKVQNRKGLYLIVMIILTSTFGVDAQSNSSLSLGFIEAYTAEFDYSIPNENGGFIKVGSWTDQVNLQNGLLIRTVERFTTDLVPDLKRTVIADQSSLAPVRLHQQFGPLLGTTYRIDFNGNELTQILLGDPSQPARVSTSTLTDSVVETGLQAVFVLSLPFETSNDIEVKTYVAGAEPKVVQKTFRIVGEETVEAMGKSFNTWKVEDPATQWTYWVRKEKPYIIKVVHPLADGKIATSVVRTFK